MKFIFTFKEINLDIKPEVIARNCTDDLDLNADDKISKSIIVSKKIKITLNKVCLFNLQVNLLLV